MLRTKNFRHYRKYIYLNPPLHPFWQTAMGKGLGERAFLPITEPEPNIEWFYIQAFFIHGIWAV